MKEHLERYDITAIAWLPSYTADEPL